MTDDNVITGNIGMFYVCKGLLFKEVNLGPPFVKHLEKCKCLQLRLKSFYLIARGRNGLTIGGLLK